jgi:hypothetical protein
VKPNRSIPAVPVLVYPDVRGERQYEARNDVAPEEWGGETRPG